MQSPSDVTNRTVGNRSWSIGFPPGRTRLAPPAGRRASRARLAVSGGECDAKSDARRGRLVPEDLHPDHVAVELTVADLQEAAADVGDIHRREATALRLLDPVQDDAKPARFFAMQRHKASSD